MGSSAIGRIVSRSSRRRKPHFTRMSRVSASTLAGQHDAISDRCQRHVDPGILVDFFVERAQGNPFFIEELINALVERGDFEGEQGAYLLKGGIDAIPLPTTVQAVVAARIDRLELWCRFDTPF